MKKRITKKVINDRFKNTVKEVNNIYKELNKQKSKIDRNKLLNKDEKKALKDEFDAEAKDRILPLTSLFNRSRKRVKSLDYKNFSYSSLHVTPKGYQENFRAKRGYSKKDLDIVVPQILEESGVTGVLVVFKVESEETGQIQYVSNYITKDLYDRLQQNDQAVFDYIAERLQAGNTKDYNLKFIYLKVIHANTKSL